MSAYASRALLVVLGSGLSVVDGYQLDLADPAGERLLAGLAAGLTRRGMACTVNLSPEGQDDQCLALTDGPSA